MAPKVRAKSVRSCADATEPTKPQPPNWPPLAPLVPANQLHIETLHTDQILIIRNLFTSKLCKDYVSFLSSLRLMTTPTKAKRDEATRVNDRFQIDDALFAQRLWDKTALRQLVEQYADQSAWKGDVLGLNPNIRVYRYRPGQFFGQHYDESNRVLFGPNKTPGRTTWTLLIYLTTCEGGETAFYPEPKRKDKVHEPIEVRMEVGMALLHNHDDCMLHEGKEVKSGEKWVLRSDLVVSSSDFFLSKSRELYEYKGKAKATITMHRTLSIRSRKKDQKDAPSHTFSFGTLRGISKAELAKKLYKLIKTENYVIDAYDNAGRERLSIASQLSDWGESTNDDAISDISDKLGVILSEIGEQEELFAQNLEDYRNILKQIRNTEQSVQPSRDQKAKISDEIQKLKYKEPTSPKLPTLEQELVRAEAQNLVAEAQLTNITRQKIKEAYDLHFAATIERAEKQIILAKYGRRLLNLLDDTPVVPGDNRPQFTGAADAIQVLADAEQDLQQWQPNLEPIHTNASGLGANLMPLDDATTTVLEVEQRELAQHVANAAESPGSQHKQAEDHQGKHLEGAVAS
ncbi:hypothetical protein DV736_g5498, partial [Chaetothyriales sp. CBS 134916]